MQKIIKVLKKQGKSIGFVPTMGALHAGHASLIQKCREENGIAVLSTFVNPAQFGPKEDFKKYPRPQRRDKLFAKQNKVDIIFYPSVDVIYPTGFLTYINVEQIDNVLCGQSRPGHFRGVATVVGKLLNIVQPDVMYLGQKDGQQVVVLRKMAADLNFPVRIKVCPTIREKDGLALSSRNQYLNSKERQEAPVLYQALKIARAKIARGERQAGKIINMISAHIRKNSSAKIDYVACVDADSLASVKKIQGSIMIALAAKFRKTRLIDNIIVNI